MLLERMSDWKFHEQTVNIGLEIAFGLPFAFVFFFIFFRNLDFTYAKEGQFLFISFPEFESEPWHGGLPTTEGHSVK